MAIRLRTGRRTRVSNSSRFGKCSGDDFLLMDRTTINGHIAYEISTGRIYTIPYYLFTSEFGRVWGGFRDNCISGDSHYTVGSSYAKAEVYLVRRKIKNPSDISSRVLFRKTARGMSGTFDNYGNVYYPLGGRTIKENLITQVKTGAVISPLQIVPDSFRTLVIYSNPIRYDNALHYIYQDLSFIDTFLVLSRQQVDTEGEIPLSNRINLNLFKPGAYRGLDRGDSRPRPQGIERIEAFNRFLFITRKAFGGIDAYENNTNDGIPFVSITALASRLVGSIDEGDFAIRGGRLYVGAGGMIYEFDILADELAPVINSFTATPDPIEVGQSSTLNWSISGDVDSFYITTAEDLNTVIASSGSSHVVTPTKKGIYNYILTVRNKHGTAHQAVQLTVNARSCINSFTATPSVIPVGGEVTLNWDLKAGAVVTAVGERNGTNLFNAGDTSVKVRPVENPTTYQITVNCPPGYPSRVETKTVDVTVTPAVVPPPTTENFVIQRRTTQEQFSADKAPYQIFPYDKQLIIKTRETMHSLIPYQSNSISPSMYSKRNLNIDVKSIAQKETDLLYPAFCVSGDYGFIFYYDPTANLVNIVKYHLQEEVVERRSTIDLGTNIKQLYTYVAKHEVVLAYLREKGTADREIKQTLINTCLLYTSPSPRD